MTFQSWKMVLLNSMTFQEEWSPCMMIVLTTRSKIIRIFCAVLSTPTAHINICTHLWAVPTVNWFRSTFGFVFYLRLKGYVFVIVCLLATLRKNFQTDLHEIFLEKVGNGPMNKWLNFGGNPDHDLYRDTGKTCLGRGMHCPSASSCMFFSVSFN